MNSLSNFAKQFAIPAAFLVAANFSAQAQNNPVESTHVDEKYAYTTVVYKNKAANDQEVLSSLESDFGIGDVVRVTLAPPPAPISAIAASEPVYADKKKGEDTWLPGTTEAAENLTASTNVAVAPKTVTGSISVSPKPVPSVAKVAAAPKPVVVAKTVAPEAPKQAETLAPKTIPAVPAGVTPIATTDNLGAKTKVTASGKSSKAHKSVKKSGKKGGQKTKFKKRKPGKQRYACPKF